MGSIFRRLTFISCVSKFYEISGSTFELFCLTSWSSLQISNNIPTDFSILDSTCVAHSLQHKKSKNGQSTEVRRLTHSVKSNVFGFDLFLKQLR